MSLLLPYWPQSTLEISWNIVQKKYLIVVLTEQLTRKDFLIKNLKRMKKFLEKDDRSEEAAK
jgi:hypothetical protein